MFDYKLLIHVTNIIVGIMYEIKLVRTPTSIQRISIVPAEKKFGKTGMHTGVHQTVLQLIKTMMIEDDDAMQFIYIQDQVKNRRLAYRETISPCTCPTGIGITPLIYTEAVIHVVEFPATISPFLGEITMDEFYIFAGKLMSDSLLPFAKANFKTMSAQKGAHCIKNSTESPLHLAASFFPQNQR
jgi:hypothetical protein